MCQLPSMVKPNRGPLGQWMKGWHWVSILQGPSGAQSHDPVVCGPVRHRWTMRISKGYHGILYRVVQIWVYFGITMTPHESWGLKSPVNRLFVQQLVQTDIKDNIKVSHHLPFVGGFHQWPVDFPQMVNPSDTRAFPCHDGWIWTLKNEIIKVLYQPIPYPDGVYTPAWSVYSKATLLPLPLECTLQPHSEYHRCTLGCHSMDLIKSLTNRNTLQCHFKCTPDGVYTPLPLL